jgi:hypothetical protein
LVTGSPGWERRTYLKPILKTVPSLQSTVIWECSTVTLHYNRAQALFAARRMNVAVKPGTHRIDDGLSALLIPHDSLDQFLGSNFFRSASRLGAI